MRIVKRILLLIVVAVVGFVAFLALGIRGNHLPLNDPPGSFVRLNVYLNTHVAETIDGSPFPELRPRSYALPADALFAKVKEAIAQMPRWEIVEAKPEDRELHAVVTSALFRFKDDVTLQVAPQPGGRPAVLVHAVSRVGKGDLGTNTRHVIDLYDALEQVGAHGEVERLQQRPATH
jgi:uncharacterized protein (DUF1499 family)